MEDLLQRLRTSLAGRYRVERKLGAGGMATVFLAHDERHRRSVAIKVLRQDLTQSLGTERFHREITIAAALQHPHVVPLYDSGDAGGLLFYVMPYVEGTSLRERLQKKGELPITDGVRILRDVADALTAAHQVGVVHRDLKPENVMLTGRHALVTDFGVARAVSAATGVETLTALGHVLGTAAYMAPEQVSADPDVDHRADIYAFGILAYELLAGRPPFRGGTIQETLAAHLSATPAAIATLRPGIPAPLAALVMRCLEKRPADRIQTAEELVRQLEGLYSTSDETVRLSRNAVSAIATRRLRPRLIAGLVVLTALSIGAAIWIPRGRTPPVNPAVVLVMPFETDSGTRKAGTLAQLLQSSLAQGLQRIGVVDVVDHAPTTAPMSNTLRVARELKAGLVVVGRILARGDSAQVHAKLISTVTGSEVVPIAPISGSLADAAALVHETTERLKGGVLLHRDPRLGADYPGTRAPLYEAYREFQRGNDLWNSRAHAEAAVLFHRAFRLDSTFIASALMVIAARLNSGGACPVVDSVASSLEPRQSELSPIESQALNRSLAACGGDLRTFVSASREIGRLAPTSQTAQYLAARSVLYMNYAREARDGLLALDLKSSQLGAVAGLYNDITDAHHKLEDYDAELRWAREWYRSPRNQMPIRARAAAAKALAALGRVSEVREIFPELLTTGSEGDTRDIARGIRVLEELTWHGHDSVASDLSRDALAAMGSSLLPLERVELLALSGDVDAAGALADSAWRVNPNQLNELWTGMLAAVRGDRAHAQSIMRNMETGRRGRTWSRAAILALLGDKELATRVLQQAVSEGVDFLNQGYHAQFGLMPLRGFAPFEAFVKPKER